MSKQGFKVLVGVAGSDLRVKARAKSVGQPKVTQNQ
jgi:hypothetical protein